MWNFFAWSGIAAWIIGIIVILILVVIFCNAEEDFTEDIEEELKRKL